MDDESHNSNVEIEDSSLDSDRFGRHSNVISQMDGNCSVISEYSNTTKSKHKEDSNPNILPTIANYNCRSLMGKSNCLAEDFEMRFYQICCLSEIWEDIQNNEHKKKIENLLEMHQISYISTPRKGQKRGGGAAIAWKNEEIVVKKLNIQIPKKLEVVWAVTKLRKAVADIKQIVLCSFYSPPKAGKNYELINHISDEVHQILRNDPSAGL